MPMTDSPSPEPLPARLAFARLEAAATRELARLQADLPSPAPAQDPTLACLAWDLGLPGEAVSGLR